MQTIGIIVLAVWLDNWFMWIAAFLLMGRAHAQFAALMHEAAHRLLFRNKRINDWVGRWLLGYPSFTPTDLYRRGHMAHHREEFGPDEPDIPLYRGYPISKDSLRRKLVRDATGQTGWKLFKGLLRGVTATDVAVRTAARRIVGTQLVLIAIGIALGHPWVYFILWFAPYLTVWRVINRLRSIAEHGGMQRSKDRRETTHTVRQSPLRAVRARAVPHRLAPRASRRRRRTDGEPAEAARRTPPLRLRDRRAGIPELHRVVAQTRKPRQDPRVTAFDEVSALMRAQTPGRRLRNDPIDDATVLELLELANHATAERRRRCEFVVVRDPDVRHQLARTYRQGWSIYKRVLRTRSSDDAVLDARQWESDHFEDVPVMIVACVARPPTPVPGGRRGRRSTHPPFPRCRTSSWPPTPGGSGPRRRRCPSGRRGRPAGPWASRGR